MNTDLELIARHHRHEIADAVHAERDARRLRTSRRNRMAATLRRVADRIGE